jgi:hypothetical protein
MDLRIFVDTEADIRLLRRMTRDIMERGRNIEGVLKSYNRFVRVSYNDFIKPVSELFIPRLWNTLTWSSLMGLRTISQSSLYQKIWNISYWEEVCWSDRIRRKEGKRHSELCSMWWMTFSFNSSPTLLRYSQLRICTETGLRMTQQLTVLKRIWRFWRLNSVEYCLTPRMKSCWFIVNISQISFSKYSSSTTLLSN